MAEGGWLPWKEQKKDIRPFPDYKDLAKPLKPPPYGLEWRRLDDGSWELRRVRKDKSLVEQQYEEEEEAAANGDGGKGREKVPEFLEHVVMPEDTLIGICMRYRVKDRELRQLNGFVGSHFRLCQTLVVPNRLAFAGGKKRIGQEQLQTKDVVAQQFRNASSLGGAEANYYLEKNDWNLSKALAEWRSESAWELQQAVSAPRPCNGAGSVNGDYLVGEDGTIERRATGDVGYARVPLLYG